MFGVSLRLVMAGSLALLVACGQPASGALRPSGSVSSSEAGATSSQAGSGRCATGQLQFAPGGSSHATGNEQLSITMFNRSGSSCFLGGYPGVEMLDAQGRHLGDARRDTNSFFGTYPGPHRVDLAPGAGTSFDLTYAGIDPCADGVPALHPAALRITPPGDYDSAIMNIDLVAVCPNTLVVHPVGSQPVRS
jgi:hypothetical protein